MRRYEKHGIAFSVRTNSTLEYAGIFSLLLAFSIVVNVLKTSESLPCLLSEIASYGVHYFRKVLTSGEQETLSKVGSTGLFFKFSNIYIAAISRLVTNQYLKLSVFHDALPQCAVLVRWSSFQLNFKEAFILKFPTCISCSCYLKEIRRVCF